MDAEEKHHVAFVLDMHNDNICHIYSIANKGLFLDPIATPSNILLSAASYARRFPKRDGEDFLRDLAPYAAPFIEVYNDGVAAAQRRQEIQAHAGSEDLTLVSLREPPAERSAALPGKKSALSWISKRAAEMLQERKAKKADSDTTSIKTSRTGKSKIGLMGGKKDGENNGENNGRDTDAVSIMTTLSFFSKGGDWCKTKTKKISGGAAKRLGQTFFFSTKRPGSKSPLTDIRAEYLARSPSTSTSTTPEVTTFQRTAATTSTAISLMPPGLRDPSMLSVSFDAREALVSGPDWSRVDNWDDCTIEAMFMNERHADNDVLGGPMFE